MNRITDLDQLMDGYRIACLAEALQPKTVVWYVQKLSYFQKYLASRDHSLDITTIDADAIRAFLTHLRTEVKKDALNPYKPAQSDQLSPLTVQGYARALKAFFFWLVRDGHIVTNPMKLVKMPKAPKVIVATLSDAQIRKLLAVINQKQPLGYRDYCMVLILLDTGVRLSELTSLKLEDIDLERGQFKVMGKGWKERIVPFGANVQRVIWRYVHQYRTKPFHSGIKNAFLTGEGQPMTATWFYRRVVAYGRAASLEGVRCSPHTFRHTFSKKFLLNGGDLFTLQKILGHTTLEMVRNYVNLATADVTTVHRRFSPMDLLSVK